MIISIMYPSDVDGLEERDYSSSVIWMITNGITGKSECKHSSVGMPRRTDSYPVIATNDMSVTYRQKLVLVPGYEPDMFYHILLTKQRVSGISDPVFEIFSNDIITTINFLFESDQCPQPITNGEYQLGREGFIIEACVVSHQTDIDDLYGNSPRFNNLMTIKKAAPHPVNTPMPTIH